MINKDLFYKESGRINVLRQTLTYLICISIALLLGYLYSIIIFLIPLVYINFFITLNFGLLLGLVCRILIKFSHNRNKKSRIILAAITSFLGFVFSWLTFISIVYYDSIPDFLSYIKSLEWILSPSLLFDAIIEINKYGTWSMFTIPFNGIGLTFIWLIESLIIILIPIIVIYKTNPYPYSELHEKWYPNFILTKDFESISTVIKMVEELQSDTLKSIENLNKGSGKRYSKIHIFYLQNEEKHYLTFENIYIEGQGKGKKNKTTIITNFIINKSEAETLLEKFEYKRSRLDEI